MKELPGVSVIVPNLNNAGRLKQCLAQLVAQSYQRALYEIIVIDNGSTDDSLEVADKFPVRLLQQTAIKSPYACKNMGIRRSSGEILAFLDSNCVPDRQWLMHSIRCMEHQKVDIVIGRLIYEFSDPPTIFEYIDFLYDHIDRQEVGKRSALPGGQMLVRRAVFDEIGFFREHMRSLGDIDWTHRAYRAGYAFGYSEASVVSYPAKPFKPFVKKYIRLGTGTRTLWAVTKSLQAPGWYLLVLKHFLIPAPKFVRQLKNKDRAHRNQLTYVQVFLLAWFIKVLYGIGMMRTFIDPKERC